MSTKTIVGFVCALGVLATPHAAPRSSPNYSIPAEALDSGGRPASSAAYRNTGSAGLIGAKGSSSNGAVTINGGYVAQVGTSVPLAVVSAISRKVHGTAGTFDIALPLTGTAGIECRTGGAGGNYQAVVTFGAPVTVGGISITSRDGLASGTQSVSGAVVTVNLSAVANAQTLGITLLNVSNGTTAGSVFVPMGVLLGDSSNNGIVNSGDAIQTRSRSGQAADGTNFRSDVNIDGIINSGDSVIVRSRSGTALP